MDLTAQAVIFGLGLCIVFATIQTLIEYFEKKK
jgi:hypothetical protein